MYSSVERFAPDLTARGSGYSGTSRKAVAKARAHELRVLGGAVHEWDQVEQIPLPDSQCTESVRVYYVGLL